MPQGLRRAGRGVDDHLRAAGPGRRGARMFAAGETSKTVSVPVTDDAVADDNETLTLVLTVV